jgi:hypothetical protein
MSLLRGTVLAASSTGLMERYYGTVLIVWFNGEVFMAPFGSVGFMERYLWALFCSVGLMERYGVRILTVLYTEGWVCDVALIEYTLGPGETQEGLGFWEGGYKGPMGDKGS